MFDNFDLKLLKEMQADADRTAEELAKVVPLSPSAIARRLRRLKEAGAIARTVALVSPQVLGRRLQALVRVQLHEHAQAAGLEALRKRMETLGDVQLCLEVSGSDDMVLLVGCRDMDAFNAFADSELAASPVVRRYETSFVKKEIKNRLAIEFHETDRTS